MCWNCLSKNHQVSNCKSEDNCRTCNKHHHSLLHHESESAVDTNTVVNNNQITNIPQNANKTYLQVIPVGVTMNGKTFKAKTLSDAGFNATLITKDLARTETKFMLHECNNQFENYIIKFSKFQFIISIASAVYRCHKCMGLKRT